MNHAFYYNIAQRNQDIIPKEIARPILKAILDDDSDKLGELISNLENIDSSLVIFEKKLPDIISQNPTMLSLCCFFSSMQCFNYLLNMNASYDSEDKIGRKCIHFAAAGGSLELMRILYQNIITNKSKDENDNDEKDEYSSENSDDDDYSYDDDDSNFVFQNPILAQKKRNNKSKNPYNVPDFNGLTPMHYAAMFGRLDIIQYLWTKGAKIDKYKDNKGNLPIHLACLYGHTETVKFLYENATKIVSKSPHILQPIHYACIGGYTSTIEYLIKQGADINALANSKTPIFYAARFGSLEAVKLLVKNGAKFNFKRRKTSPIIEASLGGHADVVNYFLQQGCDPNIYISNGMTPLIASIYGNNANIVKLLIKNGANFSDQTTKKRKGKKEISYDKESKTQLFKEIVRLNSFSDSDSFDPLIMISRNANVEIFNIILNLIDIKQFIQEDEEISQKKKEINKCLLKILENEKINRYSKIALLKEREKSSTKRNKHFFSLMDNDSDDIKFNKKGKIDYHKSDEKNDENEKIVENEKNNENEKNDDKEKNDENEKNNEKEKNDENEKIEDDQEIYKRVIFLGKAYYMELIEKDFFLNPNFCKRYQLCLNAIKAGSAEFLELLIKNKLYPPDCTELYCSVSNINEYKEILKCMINNNIPFDPNNENLKKYIISLGDIEILQNFLEKGLKYNYEKDSIYISNVFQTFNPDFLLFVLDNILIKTEIKFEKAKNSDSLAKWTFYPFDDISSKWSHYDYLNLLLDNCFHTFRYNHFITQARVDFSRIKQTNSIDYFAKIDESMLKMTNILLDKGYKFNSNGKMFTIPASARRNEISTLLKILQEIDKRSNGEINFDNLSILNVKPLFNIGFSTRYKEFIEFLFNHNFSLKPKNNNRGYIEKKIIEEIQVILMKSVQICFNVKTLRSQLKRNYKRLQSMSRKLFKNNDDDDDNDDEIAKAEEAERKSYADLLLFLLKNEAPVNTSTLKKIEKIAHANNNIEFITLAFKNYYNPKKMVLYGHKTPLELACKRGYLDIVKELVGKGFDVNESGFGDFASPLLFAKMSKNEELIAYLESVGAKPPKRNQTCSPDLYKKSDYTPNFLLFDMY